MPKQDSSNGTRLNKYLALRLGISRREADDYIKKGRVRINNQAAVIGSRITDQDTVKVDGGRLSEVDYIYLALHKPAGYVSSRRAQGSVPTLYELLPKKYHSLKPVGRLDKDSSGLLLLTNDGDFAYQMTHPKFLKTKIYQVQLDRPLEPLHQQMISEYGVQLEDGVSKFLVSSQRGSEKTGKDIYHITMREGRNRQIRRTFKALGYNVTKLHRTNFGNYALDDINPGEYRNIKIA